MISLSCVMCIAVLSRGSISGSGGIGTGRNARFYVAFGRFVCNVAPSRDSFMQAAAGNHSDSDCVRCLCLPTGISAEVITKQSF